MLKINYNPNVKPLPQFAFDTLNSICGKCGIDALTVTRTVSTPHEQAKIMYDNCDKYGTESQYKLYGKYGDQVIDVYVHSKAMGFKGIDIVEAMETKIIVIGPANVSHHCSNDPKLSIVDIAPSSIAEDKRDMFVFIVPKYKAVTKFIKPPVDPCFHLEFSC
jgi:hypothetical protein